MALILLIVVAVAAWWFVSRKKKKQQPVTKPALRVVEMPNDAEEAVRSFAQLCYATSMHELIHLGYFSDAVIKIRFGKDDSSNEAEFWFDFDYCMESFHKNFLKMELGQGFEIDGDKVMFTSKAITGLQAWKAKEALLPAIVREFTRSCPNAKMERSRSAEDDTGVLVWFKLSE